MQKKITTDTSIVSAMWWLKWGEGEVRAHQQHGDMLAVHLGSCKFMYTTAIRVARPIVSVEGRTLEP